MSDTVTLARRQTLTLDYTDHLVWLVNDTPPQFAEVVGHLFDREALAVGAVCEDCGDAPAVAQTTRSADPDGFGLSLCPCCFASLLRANLRVR